MRSLIWIAVIVVQQHSAVVADTSTINILDDKLRKFCGPQITATLSEFCHGRYLSMLEDYYSGTKTTFTPKDDESNENDYVPSIARPADAYGPLALWRHMSGHPVAMIRHPRARRTTDDMDRFVYIGVADECCLQPCSYRTLLSYCRLPIAQAIPHDNST